MQTNKKNLLLQLCSILQTVTGGINYTFSDAKQQARKYIWTDYQSKLSPETEIVYVLSDGQIMQ
jgi:hypothetical protein